jgi:hypothetical protein
LVEEFVCAKVLPLRANQSWFAVKDDERYQARGLKGLGLDVKQAWAKVLRKSNTLAAEIKVVYKKVVECVEELIGPLGTAKNKVIKVALANRHRVNRCFDLLGLTYPDWPFVELKDAEGGKKRKRAKEGDKLMGTSKRGGHGHGRAGDLRLIVLLWQRLRRLPRPWQRQGRRLQFCWSHRRAWLGGVLPSCKMPSISRLPILQVISDDDGDDDVEKGGSEGSKEVKIDGSSSSSSSSESGASGDEDDEDDDESGNPRPIGSKELGFQSGGTEEKREIESHPTGSRLMPLRHYMHIMREGREVATDEDEPRAGSGKHALGEASRCGLRHFAISCSADEPEIDLFTSLDLCDCHLVGTEEERWFLVGMYRQICMPEAEFLMSRESMDHLTEDVEVASVRAIMLAQAMC